MFRNLPRQFSPPRGGNCLLPPQAPTLLRLHGNIPSCQVSGSSGGEKREDIVVAGVIKDGNGYKVNDQSVSLERYYKALATGRAGISEAYIYDATNIRLRNIALSYRFPSSMLKKTPFQPVSYTHLDVYKRQG